MSTEARRYHIPLIYRFDRKVRIAVCSRHLVDRGTDHTSTIYIAGTGRSGTTWLSEVINHRNQYRQIFEPFHPGAPVGSLFPRHLYLRPDDPDELRLDAARQVLSGRVRGHDVDRFNKRFVSSRRVIKEISSNLFLKWLHDHFPGMPIVLIIRHPCAVLHSQMSVGWENWEQRKSFDRMLEQEALVHDHLQPFMAELRGMRYAFEQYVAMWCIQNYVPLRQFRPADIHVAFYEELSVRPEQELKALMSYLGKPFEPRMLEAVGIASLTSAPHSAILRGHGVVDSWRDELTASEVRRAMEIVAMFGFDHVYSDDPMPQPEGLSRLISEAARIPQVSNSAG